LNFEVSDFNHLYELFVELFGQQRVFFFDEIQNVNGWEMFVRRMTGNGFKFFLTGSNALLLSKELWTKLTGRQLSVELYPFSFKEFLRFKGYSITEKSLLLTEERAKIKKFFNEHLQHGGMPEYVRYKDADILKKVYDDIIYQDIVARYDIKEVKSLRELALYFMSNLGTLFSYNKLKGFLGLGSINTVKGYVEYLENSFIIFILNLLSSGYLQYHFLRIVSSYLSSTHFLIL
jgi:predicted AAA+ superfamily ATPase